MCRFLVQAELAPHQQVGGSVGVPGPDPTLAKPKNFDIGDIIDIREDDEEWGREVSKVEWMASGGDPIVFMSKHKPLIVNVPGVTVNQVKVLLRSRSDFKEAPTGKKRIFYFDLTSIWPSLSAEKKAQIQNDKEVTISPAVAKLHLKYKTGSEDGLPVKDVGDTVEDLGL